VQDNPGNDYVAGEQPADRVRPHPYYLPMEGLSDGRDRQKLMTLSTGEFIRRFLIHVLPHGFHRIRHYGLFASGTRADNIARARRLLDVPAAQPEAGDTNDAEANEPKPPAHPCPCCGGRMIIIETFERGASPSYRPAASPIVRGIDTS
jgi:Putative transposase